VKAKRLIFIFAVFGIAAGLAYWLYLKMQGEAPNVSDLFEVLKSYPRRLYLIVTGKISSDPLDIAAGFVAQNEGFSATAYPDPPGQTDTYSIGYGHQIVPGDGFDTTSEISESDALALLQQDLQTYAACVNGAVTASLNPNQLAALYDFAYNEGCAAFQGSQLLTDINNGADSDTIASDFMQWTRAGGVSGALTSRRQSEIDLFNS
jgi:GH24 family phage-related lysozyme (muramidase)